MEIETLYTNVQYDAEVAKQIQLEGNYYNCCSQTEKILLEVFAITDINNGFTNNPVERVNFTNTANQINFPKLDFPKFNDEIESWPGFADAFKSAVRNDSRWFDVQKLIYLRSCLMGMAASKIESLPSTNTNYSVAWSLLEKIYFDPNSLIFQHVSAFFDFPTCGSSSTNIIGVIVNLTTKHYRVLQALKTPFFEAFPIYAVVKKLDETRQLKWKETVDKNQAPDIEVLMDFLNERHRVLEDTIFKKNVKNDKSNNLKGSNAKLNKPYNNNSRSSSTTLIANINTFCHICKNNNFLKANHATNDCRAGECKNCGKKHHTFLHKDKSPVESSNSIACFGGKTSSQVLLSTTFYQQYTSGKTRSPRKISQ